MKDIKNIIVFTVAILFSQAFAGLEAENALEQVNNSAVLGLVGFNLDYKELWLSQDACDNGKMPKSTESGTILGYFLNTRAAIGRVVYTDFSFDYYDEKLKFDGTYSENSVENPCGPLVYKFWHKFFNANVKLGPIIPLNKNHSMQAIPYIGGGYHYWYRQHNNTGVQEKYRHYKATAGIKFNFLLADDLVLSSYAEGGRVYARMKQAGNSYSLGKNPIYEAGLELNYRVFDEFFLNGFANYTQFKYRRSGPIAPFRARQQNQRNKSWDRYAL
jgi:hypothetical protein